MDTIKWFIKMVVLGWIYIILGTVALTIIIGLSSRGEPAPMCPDYKHNTDKPKFGCNYDVNGRLMASVIPPIPPK